jgi:hypothetical protein
VSEHRSEHRERGAERTGDERSREEPTAPVSAALLRCAGLPIEFWLAASAEPLFGKLAAFELQLQRHRAEAMALADRLGRELIPDPALSARDRAHVLAVRRQLHGGTARGETEAALGAMADWPAVAAQLRAVAAEGRQLDQQLAELRNEVGAEQARLPGAAWQLVERHPAVRAALWQANPDLLDDLTQRVAAAEPWSSKRMRQRGEYLWRILTRGSARATPRGLLGQLCLLPIGVSRVDGPEWPPIRLTGELAWEWTDNVFLRSTSQDGLSPDVLVSLTPLHWTTGQHVQFWVRRPEVVDRLIDVRLRDTTALHALRMALADGPLSLGELTDRLAPAEPDGSGAAVLAGLVRHLAGLGVLELSRPAKRSVTGWQAGDPAIDQLPRTGYLDGYRRAGGPLPVGLVARLEGLAGRALRVLEVIGTPPRRLQDDLLGPEPRPLLAVLADLLERQARRSPEPTVTEQQPASVHPHDWLDAGSTPPDTGYGRLLSWLTERFATGGPVDLDSEPNLRRLPPAQPDWPIDCMIRPIGGEDGALAVLDRIEPAGVLDSRFAETLAELDPAATGAQEDYRAFLSEVERLGGGRFVEILIPPLAVRAANAIRRPPYTRCWTGDSNRSHYLGGSAAEATYLPLADITLRTVDGRVQAEAGGQPIWPIYHATRTAPPPWRELLDLLLPASPWPGRKRWRTLGWTLAGWPQLDHLPRLTVGGGALVLAPEQWRLRLDLDWPARQDLLTQCRQLLRWRSERGLPRWVSVVSEVHADPVPCDLASVHTAALFDRYVRRGTTELWAAEMLPDPRKLVVGDGRHRPGLGTVAELLLRLPDQRSPRALAQQVIAGWQAGATLRPAGATLRPASPGPEPTVEGGENQPRQIAAQVG